MNEITDDLLTHWHRIVFERDLKSLGEILAEDVVFRSPFLWKPYNGRTAAFIILSTVVEVLEDFQYHRQLTVGRDWALEFSARVGPLSLKGIDLIRFNKWGKIQEFEVFVRPANGLQALGEEMKKRLEKKGLSR